MFGPPTPACGVVTKRDGEVAQPVRVRDGVVVEVGDDLAGRGLDARCCARR